MSEPDPEVMDFARTLARMAEYLTSDECARLKGELVRFRNQESATPPQGFAELVKVAKARGFRPAPL